MIRQTTSYVKTHFYDALDQIKKEPIEVLRYKTPVGYLVFRLPDVSEEEFKEQNEMSRMSKES